MIMEVMENPLAQLVDPNSHTTTSGSGRPKMDGRSRSVGGESSFIIRKASGEGVIPSQPTDPLLSSSPSTQSHHDRDRINLNFCAGPPHEPNTVGGGGEQLKLTPTSVVTTESGEVVVVAHHHSNQNHSSATPSPSLHSNHPPLPHQPFSSQGEERETWSQSADFLLSIIGFAVDRTFGDFLTSATRMVVGVSTGFGLIHIEVVLSTQVEMNDLKGWQISWNADDRTYYRTRAFLIPYFLMLALSAIPVFYMELLLGQFIRQGPISVWKICPLFKGIGYCAVTVSYFVSFYYNTIMGWSLHFTINSFTSPLPWTTCNNSWNTKNCFIPESSTVYNEYSGDTDNDTLPFPFDYDEDSNFTLMSHNHMGDWDKEQGHVKLGGIPKGKRVIFRPPNATSPASEYFRNSVLEMGNHDIDNLGRPKLDLLVCLAIIYCLLYIILFRGIRSTGKVVWITATMPYCVMLLLLVRGLMLEGAADGIYYYLVPNMTKLQEVGVWSDAAKQIFFSSGAGFGVHLTYASYNNFHNNCFRDCMITSVVNCFTSIFAGFVIFTFLGSMAFRQGRPIEEVVNVGPGLVFEVYPEAVGTLPGANFWSLLFFLMLIMLGIDSAMGGLECVITGITDEFKTWFKGKKHGRECFMFFCVLISFLISIINVTRGGMYTFTFFDTYAAGSSLLFAVLFEVLVVSWVYGLDELCKNAESMLGFAPGIYWRICWKYVSPVLIGVIIILDLVTAGPLSYDEYEYPTWAQNFGYIFTFIPITLVPIMAVVEFFKYTGSWKTKLSYAITPTNEHSIIKNGGNAKRLNPSHWFRLWT